MRRARCWCAAPGVHSATQSAFTEHRSIQRRCPHRRSHRQRQASTPGRRAGRAVLSGVPSAPAASVHPRETTRRRGFSRRGTSFFFFRAGRFPVFSGGGIHPPDDAARIVAIRRISPGRGNGHPIRRTTARRGVFPIAGAARFFPIPARQRPDQSRARRRSSAAGRRRSAGSSKTPAGSAGGVRSFRRFPAVVPVHPVPAGRRGPDRRRPPDQSRTRRQPSDPGRRRGSGFPDDGRGPPPSFTNIRRDDPPSSRQRQRVVCHSLLPSVSLSPFWNVYSGQQSAPRAE